MTHRHMPGLFLVQSLRLLYLAKGILYSEQLDIPFYTLSCVL